MKVKIQKRNSRIKKKVRGKIIGKSNFPRLSIYRSNKYIYAQIIDDKKNVTLASVNSKKLIGEIKITKLDKAYQLGEELSKKLVKLKIKQVVFDRGSYKYLGRVRAVAEGVRKGGIKI